MNHQNKTLEISSFSDSKIIKASSFVFIAAALIVGGFFAPNLALAAATVTPAIGGTDISIDTTSAPGGSEDFTPLGGPTITETAPGDISAGTHTITLPDGWEFDTSSNITFYNPGGIILDSPSVIPSQNSFSFIVNGESTSVAVLGFSGLKVRPTRIESGISGNMTHSGAPIAGVADETANFGTLSTVAGTVTQLAFSMQPGDAVYGSPLSPQPVVKTQDQFGNDSTDGLGANLDVTLTLTAGSGVLHGADSLDIGTGVGNGIASFIDLTVDSVGTDNTLTASAGGLTSADSEHFDITQKPLTATVTVNNKDYDGDNTATIAGVALNDVEIDDTVTADFGVATAIFDDVNANDDIDITTTGVTLTGDDALNYVLIDEDIIGMADITPLGITVIPTAEQNKVYGDTEDPIFTYTFNPALISPDVFSGNLSRDVSENVGTYAYTIGTLGDGLDNYTLALVSETFGITQRTLIVTATGLNRVYNATTDATVTLLDDRVPGDVLTTTYTTATFDNEDVGTGKAVSVFGIDISGTDSANYTLASVTAGTDANITEKELIVIGSTVTSRAYDGTTAATITGATLMGVIGSDVVEITNETSGTFDNKNAELGKAVTTVMTLTGDDAGNYTLTQPTLTGDITKEEITLTAITNEKVYDGNMTAIAIPELTGGLVPGDDGVYVETYDNKNVGATKTLTPAVISIVDGASVDMTSNYIVILTSADLGTITQAPLTATITVLNKVVDEDTSATITSIVFDNLISGDDVTVDSEGTAIFADITVGPHVVSATGITITGTDAGNYSYDNTATGTGNILPVPLVVYVDDDWAVTELWADPDESGPAIAFGYDAFATIQEAINAVEASGTVNVADGTYDETITINKDGLTLLGAQAGVDPRPMNGGRSGAESIIQRIYTLISDDVNPVKIEADNVIINGFTISPRYETGVGDPNGLLNNDIIRQDSNSWVGTIIKYNILTATGYNIVDNSDELIQLKGVTDAVIEYNYGYHSVESESGGNAFSISNSTDSTIQFNEAYLTGDYQYGKFGGAIYTYTSSNISIIGNKIVGGGGITFGGSRDTHDLIYQNTGGTIQDNIIVDSDFGLEIFAENITVSGNNVSNVDDFALSIIGASVIVSDNELYNSGTGIIIEDDGAIPFVTSGISINENKIYGNISGLDNLAAVEVDATNNYWGTAVLTTIQGMISGDVNYDPYWIDPEKTILSSTEPTTVSIDATYTDGNTGGYIFGYDAFSTIQEGITAVESGGIVDVAAGTYGEAVIIDKSLTLNGARVGVDARTRNTSSGESILDGSGITPVLGLSAFKIRDGVTAVTIDGFEISGYRSHTTPYSSGSGNAIFAFFNSAWTGSTGTSNITIQNNYMHDFDHNAIVVGSVYDFTQSGWLIQKNLIEEAKYAAIELTNVVNSDVLNNKIIAPTDIEHDPGDAGIGIEIAVRARAGQVITAGTDIVVSGNEITGAFPMGPIGPYGDPQISRAGINLLSRTYASDAIATLSGVIVRGNIISSGGANLRAGILMVAESRLDGPATISNITIESNYLDGNNDGIEIEDKIGSGSTRGTHSSITIGSSGKANQIRNSIASGVHLLSNTSASGITLNYNKITGNATGVNNAGNGTLNAENNWWGNITGPTHSTNTGGTGNVVSDNVGFRPWYLSDALTGLDSASPTPTISNVSSPTNLAIIPMTVNFGEAVTGFTIDDITVGNGAKGSFSGSGSTYTFDLTPTADGAVTVDIAAQSAQDTSGNFSEVAVQFSITSDQTTPSLTAVSIASDNSEATLAMVGDLVTVSFTSNEDIQTPTVTIAGDSAAVTGANTSWVATYIMASGDTEGLVVFAINFTDLAGNDGGVITTGMGSVTFDETAPAVKIDIPLIGDKLSSTAVISFTITDETSPECSVDESSWVSCTSDTTKLSDLTEFAGLSQGAFTLYLQDTDAAGNVGTDSISLIKDTVAPTVISHTPGISAVNVESSVVTITFDEPVINADVITFSSESGDAAFALEYSGNTVTLTPSATLDSNTVYTITVTTGVTDEAGNPASEYDWQFTPATLYDIALNATSGGWNLISLPVVPNDTAIDLVLGDASTSINVVWTYDPTHPNADEDTGWMVYTPGNPEGTNNISSMTAGYGYWISVKNDTNIIGSGSLLSAGPITPPSRQLSEGWNLVGYYQIPGESSSNVESVFASLEGSYTGLWGFNNGIPYTVSTINPGDAFWISLTGAKAYTPSNL